MNKKMTEYYISVDVETSGPNPSEYSLLSIGACTVDEPYLTFYVELKPVNEQFLESALKVSGLSFECLKEIGKPPKEAMEAFAAWLEEVVPEGKSPVFVAFNAPFDWLFVADYFHRYLGYNPFGHKALDIKAFYMGMAGVPWRETGMMHLSNKYLGDRTLTHHALADALDQAEIFSALLEELKKRR